MPDAGGGHQAGSGGNGLLYSSYFGASDANNNYFPGNIGNAIAADGAGGFYITGRTSNGLKTTTSSAEPNYRANSNSSDAFVAKFNASSSGAGTRVDDFVADERNQHFLADQDHGMREWRNSVAMMQVYVDGVRKAQVTGNTDHNHLTLPAGPAPNHPAGGGQGRRDREKHRLCDRSVVFRLNSQGRYAAWRIPQERSVI